MHRTSLILDMQIYNSFDFCIVFTSAAHQPGIVKVRVYSQSETFLGETEVRYIDLMNRVVSEAVQHGIEGVTKLYGLMGKHSIDWWKQSASVKQNPGGYLTCFLKFTSRK